MGSSTIEEAQEVKIKATSAITAYIGTGANARIYWLKAPANTTTTPYVVYTTISRMNESQEFHYGYSQVRTQFSIWHDNKENGQRLAQQFVTLFDQYTGDMDGFDVLFGTVTGPIALIDPDNDRLYQFVVDVNLNYRR